LKSKKSDLRLHATPQIQDLGKPFERVMYSGGPIHSSVVAVPALKLDNEYISQTMAVMEALGDAFGRSVPERAYNKALQTMLNIYDIGSQALERRMQTIRSKSEAADYVNGRVKQFFLAIEDGYNRFPGPLFYNDSPSFVDYQVGRHGHTLHALLNVTCTSPIQLLGTVIALRYLFGTAIVNNMLNECAPSVVVAVEVLLQRPNLLAFIDSGYKGEDIFPASMNTGAESLAE
jgi:hypothetical protein